MQKLYHKFLSETSRIETCMTIFIRQGPYPGCLLFNSYFDGLVVRLHDSWVRFCRELIITSAVDEPITLSKIQGQKAPGINIRSDVINKLRSSLPPRVRIRTPTYWEPRWGDAQKCIDASNVLGLFNHSQICAAVGIPSSPVENIRRVRNYIAHRKKDTASNLLAVFNDYGLSPKVGIYKVLTTLVIGGIPVCIEWLKELQTMAEAALQ